MTTCVAIVAYDGVDDLDLAGALSPLTKAVDMGAPLSVHIVAATGRVHLSSGLTLDGLRALDDRYDVVVVPGGRGALEAAADGRLARWLTDHSAAELHAVCSGALLLADLGLLQGVPTAIHRNKAALLVARGVEYSPGRASEERRTSIGGSSFSTPKGVVVGFEVLARHTPMYVERVRARLELEPT